MDNFRFRLGFLVVVSLLVSTPIAFADNEANKIMNSSRNQHSMSKATNHHADGFDPVGLTEGMDREFAGLAFFIESMNIISLGYIGRADIRQQRVQYGLLSHDDMVRENIIDISLVFLGELFTFKILARIRKFFKNRRSTEAK